MTISIQSLIGGSYNNIWWTNCKCRYRFLKGSRNSKKSYNVLGIEPIDKILSDKRRNIIIVRQYFNSLKNSVFAGLKYFINEVYGLGEYFKFNETILEITYLPTGQKIIFKGMDKPEAITSARPDTFPFYTDIYFEEAFEIKNYDAFDIVDGSFRGNAYTDISPSITFCFNAWNKNHWLYDKFFKGRLEDNEEWLETHKTQELYLPNESGPHGKGMAFHISTYKANEFRSPEADEAAAYMREQSHDMYCVQYLGMWGNAAGAAYPEYNDTCLIYNLEGLNICDWCVGIDTGFSSGDGHKPKDRYRSANTMILMGITGDWRKMVAVDEYFDSNEGRAISKTEPEVIKEEVDKLRMWVRQYGLGISRVRVFIDCADIGFKDNFVRECKRVGLNNVLVGGATKLPISARVQFSRQMMLWGEYLISNKCANLVREFKNSQKGANGEDRENLDDHMINASEYAWYPWHNKIKRYTELKYNS